MSDLRARAVGELVRQALERLQPEFGPNYNLTFVGRYTKGDLDNADMIITSDDLPAVRASIKSLEATDEQQG